MSAGEDVDDAPPTARQSPPACLGNRGRFDVDLRDGWCVMQDRFVVGGFAAVADGEATLLAGCGAVRTAGIRRAVPLLFGERAALRTLGKVRRHVQTPGGWSSQEPAQI